MLGRGDEIGSHDGQGRRELIKLYEAVKTGMFFVKNVVFSNWRCYDYCCCCGLLALHVLMRVDRGLFGALFDLPCCDAMCESESLSFRLELEDKWDLAGFVRERALSRAAVGYVSSWISEAAYKNLDLSLQNIRKQARFLILDEQRVLKQLA
jgi:hypothetical protein